MKKTLTIFAILIGATLIFHTALNYMEKNIEDFETVPLPPKKQAKLVTNNSVIKVDATSRSTWTLVDFSTGQSFTVDDPEKETERLKSSSWDLGFQRTKIISNGGITNPDGKTGVINLGSIDFDAVHEVPPSGYAQDNRSLGSVVNKGLSGWYTYRTRTHNIESHKNVYAIRRHDGSYMKMRIINYYCSRDENECRSSMCTREEAACLTLEYALAEKETRDFPTPVAPPATQTVSQSIP